MDSKTIKTFAFSLLSFLMAFLPAGCSDGDEPASNDIVGTWYGHRVYYNGSKHQYLTFTFNEDKTGTMEYESPVSFSAASFTYTVKGNTISCNGVYASTYDDWPSQFSKILKINNDRITIPDDQFHDFILTRDGSVTVDGDGNEI